MKKEVIGINHLREVLILINRSNNLLNGGNDIYPFYKWKDSLKEIKEDIEEYIKIESAYDGDI